MLRNRAPTKISIDKLKEDVSLYCDTSQYERTKRLGASRSSLQKALKRLNITCKKNYKTSECKKAKRLKFQNKIKRYKDKGTVMSLRNESVFCS